MLLTAKPMVYLLNLSREDYLANRIIEKDKIEDSITMGGRFQTKMISYSVEHEKLIKTDPTARS